MAAGIASIGVFVVPAWIMVYSLALLKPEVPATFFAVLKASVHCDCTRGEPSVLVEP
jgi:hypothetical protein